MFHLLNRLFGRRVTRKHARDHMDPGVQRRWIDMLDLEARIEGLYKYETGHPIGDLVEQRPRR